jgi:hypothetical protein
MSKNIDAGVLADINSKNYAGIILCRLHFSPVLRYCNSAQSVYWDESGGGEQEYVGVGNLASMSVLTETGELSAVTIQLSLSGIPNTAITDVFSDEYSGKPVYIWYGTLNPNTYAIEGGQNGPVLVFAGQMDYCNLEFGETATITLNATSRLADWDRARGGRFNQGYQKQYVDPTDTGFRYVNALQTTEIAWGGSSIFDPDGRGGGGGGGQNPLEPPNINKL